MKPYIVCHMVASIDGRILQSRWHPQSNEVSLAVVPVVDGAQGAPSVFDSTGLEGEARAPIVQMALDSCEVLEGGAVWLRYRLRNEGMPSRSDVS